MNAHAPVAASPASPTLRDLLYLYSANAGALHHQMAITDRAMEEGRLTATHLVAQNILDEPCHQTLVAICAYRPTSDEEADAKAAFLEDFIIAGELGDDGLRALIRSTRAGPVPTVASPFAEWWHIDQHVEPVDETEDDANNDRMRELKRQMLALPTVTAADLAMKTIAETYHGSFTMEHGNSLMAHVYGLAGVDLPKHILREMQDVEKAA